MIPGIIIDENHKCCGCMACASICPKHCIEMKTDAEGFLYPCIGDDCINCNKCQKSCPLNMKSKNISQNLTAYAAINKHEDIRLNSSSGGIFYCLAKYVILNNGVVFGASFDDAFRVRHISITKVEDICKLQGSKYVQSSIGDSFRNAKEYLQNGRLVLFSGTPCQIAGLKLFLGQEFNNLICQDVICHGVPSPIVWEKYLNYRKKSDLDNPKKIFFRHKKYGWKIYSLQFEYSNCKEYMELSSIDLYMRMFLLNYSLRPSCYECLFKDESLQSDITLGDFWGIENELPEFDDNKGTSVVLIHSNKGVKIFDCIKDEVKYKNIEPDLAIKYNTAFIKSPAVPEKRELFFKIVSSKGFGKEIENIKHVNFLKVIKRKLIARKFKIS